MRAGLVWLLVPEHQRANDPNVDPTSQSRYVADSGEGGQASSVTPIGHMAISLCNSHCFASEGFP